jgi:phosphoglycolate phosphatase-like HAD superfamily hydrolase
VNNLSQIEHPTILALDFDGVICDGMSEYFATAWETYCRIWQIENREIPNGLGDRFRKFRPLIETGWEMPVLIRALILNIPEVEITQDWSDIRQKILHQARLNYVVIAQNLDGFRDEWIEQNVDSWLRLHEFYPGVVSKIKELLNTQTKVVIITTKEGRFVTELLKQQGIDLPQECIFGKECKWAKSETLKQLLSQNLGERIWFVEDRWLTLEKIANNPELTSVKLYLADWGYNTESEHNLARIDNKIKLISLEDFRENLSHWNAE